ncbi:MAG: ATP-binding protein [Minicystis sp.]
MTSAFDDLAKQLALAIERRFDHEIALGGDDPAAKTVEQAINTLLKVAWRAEVEAKERQRVEESLRKQQAVLRHIINSIPYTVFWKDRDLHYLGCNDALCRDAGRSSPEEVVGLTDYDMPWTREESDFFRLCDNEVMESGRPLLDIEEHQMRADGTTKWLLTSKVPLRDEGGVYGILGIYTDITERKRMEDELYRAKVAAEEANRAKSAFFANVSHELRTPLTLILGPLDVVLDGGGPALPEPVRARLGVVRRNAVRLGELVNDLLDASKLEAGKMTVEWRAVPIVELTRAIVEDARQTAESRRIDLRLAIEDDPGPIPLDRRMFEKIALNLVGNALKFTPEGGRVDVRVRMVGPALDGPASGRKPRAPMEPEVELEVSDTGIGIAADKIPLLFRRFQQVDDSASRKYEGTGLGLALVRELAELLGGRVSVESELGRGSRFRVTFPRSADRLAALAIAEVEEHPASRVRAAFEAVPRHQATSIVGSVRSDKPRLLLAEDHPDMRAYVIEILGDQYDIVAVENGARALAAIQESVPAVVVSDVMMPEMDGIELTRRLKADPVWSRIPVVLLTARAGEEAVVTSFSAGADDYMPKPFSPAELKARVGAAVRAYTLTLTAEELKRTRNVIVSAEKLASAGHFGTSVAVEMGPQARAIERAVEQLGASVAQEARELANALIGLAAPLDVPEEGDSSEVDLGKALSEWRGDLAAAAKLAAGREIVVESDPELRARVVEGDVRGAVERVVAYLANAPGERQQGSAPLAVRAHRLSGRATITIVEPDLALDEAEREVVFEPRVAKDGRSIAAGMLVARYLVERGGGELRLDEGPGTTFRIML